MIRLLKDWKGTVEVNGKLYDSVNALESSEIDFSSSMCIKLHSMHETVLKSQNNAISDDGTSADIDDTEKQYQITVKQYMTKPASPEFDFMAKWNNNNPMPMRTMIGTIEKETKGMVYMHLHGRGLETITCMRCGRELTNPISRHYGIGPECMSKLGFCVDISDISTIKEKLSEIEWSGWLIKSAITSKEEI